AEARIEERRCSATTRRRRFRSRARANSAGNRVRAEISTLVKQKQLVDTRVGSKVGRSGRIGRGASCGLSAAARKRRWPTGNRRFAEQGRWGMTDDRVRGRFIWHELRTPNPAGARDFYSTALGWKTEGAEPDSPHSTFVASSGPLGGCAAQAPTDLPRWIPFVTVADVDDSFRQAVDLGAGVVVEPTAIEE